MQYVWSLERNYIIRTTILIFCSGRKVSSKDCEHWTVNDFSFFFLFFSNFELVSCSFLIISIWEWIRLEFNIFRSLQLKSDVEFDLYHSSFSLSLSTFFTLSVFISRIKDSTEQRNDEHYSLYVKNGNCCRSGNGKRIYCKYVR